VSHTITLVASPHIEMNVSLPSMVASIEIREFGKKRTWVFRQGVEMESIDDFTQKLQIHQRVQWEGELSRRLRKSVPNPPQRRARWYTET
jgi:hypothetical protein